MRYVGKTVLSTEARLSRHMRDAQRRRTPVYAWVRKLIGLGLRPLITVLEECRAEEWREREIDWIARERRTCRLLNVADGGDRPHCSADVLKRAGRRASKARTSTPLMAEVWNLKRNMGLHLKKGHVSDRAKEKLREAAMRCPELFACYAGLR